MSEVNLQLGDCLEVLRSMAENSVDSIVTDPPYGLSFMGKKWDYDVPSTEIWAECLRALKPGGHLLAFAGTRTQHRMAVRIEDAGFEIRDMIAWVYGSGFPKSHNGQWGGTALKPALEPITMARKPLAGTVEANWRMHGTGALNIEACRVDGKSTTRVKVGGSGAFPHKDDSWVPKVVTVGSDDGRWPANLIHDGSDEVLSRFPSNAGAFHSDAGSAARFFYCAKASRADRNDGLPSGGVPAVATQATMRQIENSDWSKRNGNHHPTVKPTDLMAYLIRLVTPTGGTTMDPFMGSGSTGVAAVKGGFGFIGIEREPEYFQIAKVRVDHAKRQGFQQSLLELDAA